MSPEAVGVLVAIAVVSSVVAQALSGYSVGGFLVNTAIGFIGAVLGMWLVDAFQLPRGYEIMVGGTVFPLVWAVVGSAALVAGLGALWGQRRW